MIKKIKDEIAYYNKWYNGKGILMFIAINIMRVVMFPIMLLVRLWQWVYHYDD